MGLTLIQTAKNSLREDLLSVRELILGKDGSILCRNERNDVALGEEPSSLDSRSVVLAV